VNQADRFNNSLDNRPTTFPQSNANPDTCQDTKKTDCTVLAPAECAGP
jgi:hypothetical protein